MIAVIQVTDRVVSLCKLYVEYVRDLPADIRTILVELAMLRAVFENLKFLIDYDAVQESTLLHSCTAPVEECKNLIAELETLLDR